VPDGFSGSLFEPGEIVPAFSITDAVRDGKVAAGYTWLGYDQGKTAASALLAAVPFGMEPAEFTAWWFEAGGRALGEKLYARYHAHPIMCGLTGPETAGWFRHRIESLDDLQGLKIRFAGIGGKVIERLGASVTMLPGGEIFQALEKGAIDASEFSLPIVDQALGFNRVAPYKLLSVFAPARDRRPVRWLCHSFRDILPAAGGSLWQAQTLGRQTSVIAC